MNKPLDTQVQGHITDFIRKWNTDVNERIDELQILRTQTQNEDYKIEIDALIEILRKVNKLAYPDLVKTDSFNKPYNIDMAYRNKKYDRLSEKEKKLNQEKRKSLAHGGFVSSKTAKQLNDNKKRQIRIKSSQFKLVDKILTERLLDYQRNKKVNMKKVDESINRISSDIANGVAASKQSKIDELKRINEKIRRGRILTKSELELKKELEKEQVKYGKQIDREEKKQQDKVVDDKKKYEKIMEKIKAGTTVSADDILFKIEYEDNAKRAAKGKPPVSRTVVDRCQEIKNRQIRAKNAEVATFIGKFPPKAITFLKKAANAVKRVAKYPVYGIQNAVESIIQESSGRTR